MNSQPVQLPTLKSTRLGWRGRLRSYVQLARLDRPIGIYLLLWPTLWALWIAGAGHPAWRVVLVFVLGVILMRSAGCAINDYADRHFDGEVKRTASRPIVSGQVSPREALWVFLVLILASFGLVLTLNTLTIQLSVAAVLLAVLYPFTKRFTHWPQIILGAAFGWAVPMAFAALQNQVPMIAWWLFLASLLWTLIYDTEYAMTDRDDDLRIGIKSTAIHLGRYDLPFIVTLQLLLLGLLTLIGIWQGLGMAYFVALALGSFSFVYQYRLIRNREPMKCFEAFLVNHYFGMTVFLGLFIHYLK